MSSAAEEPTPSAAPPPTDGAGHPPETPATAAGVIPTPAAATRRRPERIGLTVVLVVVAGIGAYRLATSAGAGAPPGALPADAHADAARATPPAPLPAAAPVIPRRPGGETTDEEQMTLGLDALYGKKDPVGAAVIFRRILAHNPEHYGATFQLAMALDRAEKPTESRPLWERVAGMAAGYHDEPTLADARRRMAEIDQASAKPPDEAEQTMNAGLEALYTKKDAIAAAAFFRQVLAKNPDHLGANYQLAKALDKSGKPVEARALWQKVAALAAKYNDTRSAEDARKRLSGGPPPAGAP